MGVAATSQIAMSGPSNQATAFKAGRTSKIGKDEGPFQTWYRRLRGVFWAVCGLVVIQKSELIRVILDEPAVDRLVFGSGVFAWLVFAAIGFYLTQLSNLKTEREWKREYPNHIPVATACGVMGFFLIVCGLWGHYKGWAFVIIMFELFCMLEALSAIY